MSSHYKPSLEKCGITTIEIDIFEPSMKNTCELLHVF